MNNSLIVNHRSYFWRGICREEEHEILRTKQMLHTDIFLSRLHSTNVLFRAYFSASAWVTHDTLTQHLDPRWQLKDCGRCSCHFLWPSLQRRTRRSKQEVILNPFIRPAFILWHFDSRPSPSRLSFVFLVSSLHLPSPLNLLSSPRLCASFPLIFLFICCFLFPLSPHLTSLLSASQLPVSSLALLPCVSTVHFFRRIF